MRAHVLLPDGRTGTIEIPEAFRTFTIPDFAGYRAIHYDVSDAIPLPDRAPPLGQIVLNLQRVEGGEAWYA